MIKQSFLFTLVIISSVSIWATKRVPSTTSKIEQEMAKHLLIIFPLLYPWIWINGSKLRKSEKKTFLLLTG